MTRIPSTPTNLYAAIVHLFSSPVALCLQVWHVHSSVQRPLARQRVMLSRRVIAYYGLIRASRSLPPAYVLRPRRVFALRPMPGSERVPNLLCVSFLVRAVFRTPADRIGALTVASPSVLAFALSERLGIRKCSTPVGSCVVCVFEAAKFALCYGPESCSPFTDKDFYIRAFIPGVTSGKRRV